MRCGETSTLLRERDDVVVGMLGWPVCVAGSEGIKPLAATRACDGNKAPAASVVI